MFTGLVEAIGRLIAQSEHDDIVVWTIHAPTLLDDLKLGDSVSVNGVCLTVTSLTPTGFTTDIMGETIQVSALAHTVVGAALNLERALRLGDRLGGHLVQGHVDATTTVLSVTPHENWTVIRFGLPISIAPLVIHKGSITVDGVALTVSRLHDGRDDTAWFEVSLIPETLVHTTLGQLAPGNTVNLESDLVARQLQRLVSTSPLDALMTSVKKG